jgi:hypothetical protein
MTLGRYGQPEYPHELLRKHAFVRERCACGGVIEARTSLPPDIEAAAFVHARSTPHRKGIVRWHQVLG